MTHESPHLSYEIDNDSNISRFLAVIINSEGDQCCCYDLVAEAGNRSSYQRSDAPNALLRVLKLDTPDQDSHNHRQEPNV